MRTFLLAVLTLMLSPISAISKEHDYAVGQVWEFASDAQTSVPLLRIQEIASFDSGGNSSEVFHISVIDVDLAGDGTFITLVEHLPVSRQTLDASVTRLSDRSAAFPDYRSGMEQWRAANGGVFTITMSEIIAILRQSVRRMDQPSPNK